jgi:hypothetical protein
MSEDQETANNQPGPGAPGQIDYITQAVTALKQRTLRALSPWTRRRLQTAGSRPEAQVRRSTLSVGHTRSFLNRVRRSVDRATVWKPNLGPMGPAVVQRFSHTVANRLRAVELIGVKRGSQPPAFLQRGAMGGWGEELELILPVGPQASGPTPGELGAGSRIRGPSIFSMPRPPVPPASRPAPSRTPRAAATRRPQRRSLDPKARLFARIEEVSSAGKPSPEAKPPTEGEDRARDREVPAEVSRRPVLPEQARPERPAVQREAEAGRPLRVRPPRETPRAQPEPRPQPRRAAEPPSVQREARPERPLRMDLPEEAPLEQPEPRPEPPRAPEPPPVRREAEPERPLRVELPEAAPPEQPERRPEPRRAAEPPAIQREAEPEMPLRVELPEEGPPEPPERRPEPRRAAEPPAIQREAEPERPLRVELPEAVPPEPPERRPEPRRAAEPPAIQREAEPERPLRVKLPEAAPPEPPDRPPEPRRVAEPRPESRPAAEPPPVQREEALDMPLRTRPLREAPPAQPEPAPEPRRAAEPPPEPPRPAGPPQAEEPAPEAGEPPTVARDILARAASRARLPLSKLLAPASGPPKIGPKAARIVPPVLMKRMPGRATRPRPALPALHTRGPDVYVGPSLPFTLLGFESAHPARSRPAGPRPGLQPPATPSARFQALLEAREVEDGQPLVLPALPRPVSPRAPSSSPPARPAQAVKPGVSRPDERSELSLPLAPPPAPQPAPAEVVQRQPEPPAISSVTPPQQIVQRAEGEEPSGEARGGPDLSELARQIYPLVKRMLAIERERRPDR